MEQPDPKHYNDFLQSAIQLLDTLVLSIELPPAIVAAINRQTEQYYQIQEYKFRVEREAQESKRKQIEANGIAAFQRTVSQGISDSYLRWRGIEATLALAQSPNAKIVIIGTNKDGLPLILGNVDTPAGFGDNAAAAGKRRGTAVRSAAGRRAISRRRARRRPAADRTMPTRSANRPAMRRWHPIPRRPAHRARTACPISRPFSPGSTPPSARRIPVRRRTRERRRNSNLRSVSALRSCRGHIVPRSQ